MSVAYLAELRDAIDDYEAEEQSARERLRARLLAALGIEGGTPPIQQLAQQLASAAEVVEAAAPVAPSPAGETDGAGIGLATSSMTPPATVSVCADCGRPFANGAALGGHRKVHRAAAVIDSPGRDPEQPALGTVAAPLGSPAPTSKHSYLCARCTERFADREALLAHNRAGHPPDSAGLKPLGQAPRQVNDMIPAVKLA